jgi:hypothetical protein
MSSYKQEQPKSTVATPHATPQATSSEARHVQHVSGSQDTPIEQKTSTGTFTFNLGRIIEVLSASGVLALKDIVSLLIASNQFTKKDLYKVLLDYFGKKGITQREDARLTAPEIRTLFSKNAKFFFQNPRLERKRMTLIRHGLVNPPHGLFPVTSEELHEFLYQLPEEHFKLVIDCFQTFKKAGVSVTVEIFALLQRNPVWAGMLSLLAQTDWGKKRLTMDSCSYPKEIKDEFVSQVFMDLLYPGLNDSSGLASIREMNAETLKETLNAIISGGPFQGMSCAFLLSLTPEGLEVLRADGDRLLNLIEGDTLNSIIPSGAYAGHSVAYALASTDVELGAFFAEDGRLLKDLDAGALNHIMPRGAFAGHSMAFCLASTPAGRGCLLDDIFNDQINRNTFNHIIQDGECEGQSVAFALASAEQTLEQNYKDIFTHDIRKLISNETFNHIIECGDYAGQSMAFVISNQDLSTLMEDDGRLLKMISKETLNHIVTSKDYKGWSLAFSLVPNGGADLLQANDYHLASMITVDTLNYRIPDGEVDSGESLALHLASTEVGIEVLMHDNCRLLNMISEETLNHIIASKGYRGRSIAFALARGDGVDLLKANSYRLARMITSDTLNYRIPDGQGDCGESLAFHLASAEVGIEVLMHDNCRLLNMISEETLNHVITSKDYKGWSLAFALARDDGVGLLQANDYHLASMITSDTLNHRIPDGEVDSGESLAFRLALTEDGRKILMHDNYRLLNMISEETLHHKISNGPYKGNSIECLLLSTLAGCKALEHRYKALLSKGDDQLNSDSKALAKTLSAQDKIRDSIQKVPYGSASSSALLASGRSHVVSSSRFFSGGSVQSSEEDISRSVLAGGSGALPVSQPPRKKHKNIHANQGPQSTG